MKKLIVLFLFCLAPLLISAQRVYANDSMTAPTGADTTWNMKFFTGNSWSIQFNYSDFDSTAASSEAELYVFSAAFPDSLLYSPIWVDNDLDGSNDNPWSLSDSTLTIWGDSWPFRFVVFKLERDSVPTGRKLHYWYTKQ